MQELARQNVPAPVVGYELGDQAGRPSWPGLIGASLVVLSGPPATRKQKTVTGRMPRAGWHARTAREWSVNELAAQLTATTGGENQ